MFGADSKPHAKDVSRVSRNVAGVADAMTAEDDFGLDWFAQEDAWYQQDDGYGYGYEEPDDAYGV